MATKTTRAIIRPVIDSSAEGPRWPEEGFGDDPLSVSPHPDAGSGGRVATWSTNRHTQDQVEVARAVLRDVYCSLLPEHMAWSERMEAAARNVGVEPRETFAARIAFRGAVAAEWEATIVPAARRLLLSRDAYSLPALREVATYGLVDYLETGDGLLAAGESGCRRAVYCAVVRAYSQEGELLRRPQCEALSANGIERCLLDSGHAGDHVSPWGKI